MITLPGLFPIVALITMDCHSLVIDLFPPTLDQELPESPWFFSVSLALPRSGTGPEESFNGKFLLNEQIKRLLHLPRRLPTLFSRISWMLRVPPHTYLAPSALVPHDTHPHLSLPQPWPPRGPLSCVRPSSPMCYREQVRGQGHHPCHITPSPSPVTPPLTP